MKEQVKKRLNQIFIESVVEKDGLMEDWLALGADINAVNSNNCSALMLACGNGDYETAKRLLELGADVNKANSWGEVALILAVSSHNLELLSLLLENGADVNAQTKGGITALMCASFSNAKTVEFLLNHGAEVDKRDREGNTALMIAAMAPHCESMLTLLKFGADAKITNSMGKSATNYATKTFSKIRRKCNC